MNKQERNRLYKLMLRLYKLLIENECDTFGFCHLIRQGGIRILIKFPREFTEEEIELLNYKYYIKKLEELMEYKPKEIFYTCNDDITNDSDQFWFPVSDTATRIRILEECIEKTK